MFLTKPKTTLLVIALSTAPMIARADMTGEMNACPVMAHGMTMPAAVPLSAGATPMPNGNYTGSEPAHNTRVPHPYEQLIPALRPDVPVQLKPHSRLVLTDIEDRPFFDYFAWQTFIGLVWPAAPNNRGVPRHIENFLTYNTSDGKNLTPVVWESFRTIPSLLQNPVNSGPAPGQPPAWNATNYTRPFNLDLTSKHPAGLNEAFSSPLIDQNRKYVRYQLQLNEVLYAFIRANKWYLKGNLPKSPTVAGLPPLPLDKDGKIINQQQPQTNTVVEQPVNGNSITIKSAWRIMIETPDPLKPWEQKDDLSRYFVSEAIISDPVTGEESTTSQKVGLVGLHIVVKTPQFSQGIWASFEHVDNLSTPALSNKRPSFNKGDGTFYPSGFSYQPPAITSDQDAVPESRRTPVEVSRIYKIPDTPVAKSPCFPQGLSTRGMNKTYRKLLEGTVWQNYQLVITQWPTDPTSFYAKPFLYPRGFDEKPPADQPPAVQKAYDRAMSNAKNAYPRWSGLPIPQVGALNTTMETYFQNPGDHQSLENTSCMGCHYGASDTDYFWALKLRTWPQPYNQGRIYLSDSVKARKPAHTE